MIFSWIFFYWLLKLQFTGWDVFDAVQKENSLQKNERKVFNILSLNLLCSEIYLCVYVLNIKIRTALVIRGFYYPQPVDYLFHYLRKFPTDFLSQKRI